LRLERIDLSLNIAQFEHLLRVGRVIALVRQCLQPDAVLRDQCQQSLRRTDQRLEYRLRFIAHSRGIAELFVQRGKLTAGGGRNVCQAA